MSYIKCKDYIIFKFPRKITLDWNKSLKWSETYHKLIWGMTEMITGISRGEYYQKYLTSAWDCMIEKLEDEHGIIVSDRENYYLWLVPKDRFDIKEYFRINAYPPVTYKILQIARIGIRKVRHEHWRRDDAEQLMKEQMRDFNIPV